MWINVEKIVNAQLVQHKKDMSVCIFSMVLAKLIEKSLLSLKSAYNLTHILRGSISRGFLISVHTNGFLQKRAVK